MDQVGKSIPDLRLRLPGGSRIAGDYVIERELGAGGFGITYMARDVALARQVAIKEYFPLEFGDRDTSLSIHPKSAGHGQHFEWGRTSFLNEAKTLATLKHPNIVQVLRYFETNNTAYMVLEYEEGQSFGKWLMSLGRSPTQAELDSISTALLDALSVLHGKGLLHRDLALDNIIIRPDNTPVLLDFGAARQAIAEHSRTLTGIVKAGFSPPEQYVMEPGHQGAWTDIYALGAILYRAVTGEPPDSAPKRQIEDSILSTALAAKSNYRPGFLHAIDRALSLKPADRPQNAAAFRTLLFSSDAASTAALTRVVTARADTSRRPSQPANDVAPADNRKHFIAAGAAFAIVLAGTTAWMASGGSFFASREATTTAAVSEPAPATPVTSNAAGSARPNAVPSAPVQQAGQPGAGDAQPTSQNPPAQNQSAAASSQRAEEVRRAEAERTAAAARKQAEEAQRAAEADRAAASARQAEDARRAASEKAAAETRAQEQNRTQVAAAPPPAPVQPASDAAPALQVTPAPAPAYVFDRFAGYGLDGDGYNRPGAIVADYEACTALCEIDSRCKAVAFSEAERRCKLHDAQTPLKQPGSSVIGLKRPENASPIIPKIVSLKPPAPPPAQVKPEKPRLKVKAVEERPKQRERHKSEQSGGSQTLWAKCFNEVWSRSGRLSPGERNIMVQECISRGGKL